MSKVKVTIPVVVQPDGTWAAMAASDWDENDSANEVEEILPHITVAKALYWVEVELDVPLEVVVQGVVTDPVSK